MRKITVPLQLAIIVLFYLGVWYIGGNNLLAAIVVASLASIHAGLAINFLGHRNAATENWPLLSALLLAPSFTHQHHHSDPRNYNEAGPHGIDVGAIIIKHLLLTKTQ
jgi:hypothetical protein